jgi:hypothetical protein
MNKPTYKKILEHPDREEIINKLSLGLPVNDIHDWLKSKYTVVGDAKLVLSEKILKAFQHSYLDFYRDVESDLAKTKSALTAGNVDQLDLVVKSSPAYKDAMLKTIGTEYDIRQTIKTLALNIETRLAQIFDTVQEDPRNINTKIDRLLIDYTEVFGNLLEKIYKFTEQQPDQVIQHNVTLQVVDQHISVFHDVIKKVLSQMDLETSLYFMEVFNDEFGKLKMPIAEAAPTQEMKMAEVKLLNETINKKINDDDDDNKK